MKYLVGYVLYLMVIVLGGTSLLKYVKAQDNYIRNRVVQLQSERGGCTGIQIQAPSGKVYTLTAKHCFEILENGKVKSTNEQGKSEMISFVAIDDKADLLLLTAPKNALSIQVGEKTSKHEHVHTITHGALEPSYRTDGEILAEQIIHADLYPILEPEQFEECLANKMEPVMDMENGLICAMSENVMFTTAMVVPGSSGGPLLNDAGDLVGIVSVSNGPFSGMVPIQDIHSFLAGK